MLSLFAQLNSRSLDPAQDLSRIAAAGHLTSTDDYRELAPACSPYGLEKVRDELAQLLFVRRDLGENNEVHFLIDKLHNLIDRSRSQPLLSTTTAHSVPKLAQYRRRR
ncbi:uncharacterized protein JCM10292_005425 [Rhodotorula paludigena]|uniref:uncharacterized protein n=1 Tax=Rhodotorula paludigena TaxID=86838 RepID=UPI00316B59AF